MAVKLHQGHATGPRDIQNGSIFSGQPSYIKFKSQGLILFLFNLSQTSEVFIIIILIQNSTVLVISRFHVELLMSLCLVEGCSPSAPSPPPLGARLFRSTLT